MRIFGVYELMPKNFKFLKGDRNSIICAVESVKTKYTSQNEEEFLAHYHVPNKYIIPKHNKIDKPSVGSFFGKKVRVQLSTSSICENSKMVDKLFIKAKKNF